MTHLKPKMISCETGHAIIMHSDLTSCPLCCVTRYLDVVVKRMKEAKDLADYLLSLMVVSK